MADKTLTPVQRAEAAEATAKDLQAQIDHPDTGIAALKAKLQTANDEVSKAQGKLADEVKAHGETKVKLTTAESNFNTEKAAHDLLKADFETKVVKAASAEAAKVVAGQGLPDPAKTTVAGKPGEVQKTDEVKPGDYLGRLSAGAKADLDRINQR